MVDVTHDTQEKKLDCPIALHPEVQAFCQHLQHLLDSEYDNYTMIFGDEGVGKTVLALQMAYYMDADFDVDNIVFTAKQFKRAVEELPRGSSIVWDESEETAGHHLSNDVIDLKAYMQKMRQQNKTILSVKPQIRDVNRYFINRSRWGGIEVYDKPEYDDIHKQRGYGRFYDNNELREYSSLRRGEEFEKKGVPFEFFDMTNLDDFPVSLEPDSEYNKKKEASYASSKSFSDKEDRAVGALVSYCKDEKLQSKAYDRAEDWIDMSKRGFYNKVDDWMSQRFEGEIEE